jgi:Zn-dependent protease with chaperone function
VTVDINSGVDPLSGIPSLGEPVRLDQIQWPAVKVGLSRYPWACFAALLSSWTLLAVALWLAALGALIGGIAGFVGGSHAANQFVAGTGQAGGMLGGLGGMVFGFGVGFIIIYGESLLNGGFQVIIALLLGAAIAAGLTLGSIVYEPWLMWLHGFRRPTRAELRVLHPLADHVGQAMGLPGLPPILIDDIRAPAAWAYARHIVVSKRLLELPTDELGGILAHELHHWRTGDAVGTRFVSMCALPAALSMVIIGACRKQGGTFVGFISLLGFWPFAVLTRFLILPVLAWEGRGREYEADAAAVAAGYGPGLMRALDGLRIFEPSRSGWEEALTAAHPPVDFRLEALEEHLAQHFQVPLEP